MKLKTSPVGCLAGWDTASEDVCSDKTAEEGGWVKPKRLRVRCVPCVHSKPRSRFLSSPRFALCVNHYAGVGAKRASDGQSHSGSMNVTHFPSSLQVEGAR